ncbi:glycosyl hydrolase family 43 protein [Aspergillus nomiae NRRL 13137]|uniref:Glycosyl hydrolase family 43 protein n=1 Tax=Aspergillus nomiae NRRL (strain ATCC 15546 / NRRL 13137 / CBS 260.88 / M93) TaxID=1509407 RepID=A0A0L1JIE5_ASPN3|nr:glycosyl hydrolase family 43 protein [Aspergillus nomiae NRRL 13137]KNG91173.1 glycosyl hydrolase family 43 protein [Aspergillus nomiae NRRL 13137]
MILGFLIAGLGQAAVAAASLQIVPGATWTAASTNQHVQAHGGGIIEVDSTYYWIGENKLDGSAFQSVNCYSSKNLVEWTFVGELLSRQSSGDLGPDRIVERPKVIYNDATSKYVLWMHIDSSDYGEAKTGVATSSSVCGTYEYLGSFQPLGYQSRDMGLYKDDDGTGYLLTEDRPNGLRINKLTDDFTNVTETIHLFAEHVEAPALYKQDGVYFFFGSQLTGWSNNDNKYVTATNLSGPWTDWEDFAPSGANTFESQTTFILGVGDSVMYMGDRWDSSNLMRSTYIWLPLTIEGTTATLNNETAWVLPLDGTWSSAGDGSSYEAESSDNALTNGAKIISCSGCSGGKDHHRVRYANGNNSQRFANVTVNGQSHVLAFLPSGSGNTPFTSTLHTTLDQGDTNTITFSVYEEGWGPDLDELVISE